MFVVRRLKGIFLPKLIRNCLLMPIIFHLNISWFWKRGIPEAALLRDQFVCAFSLASGKISQGNQLSSANR